MYMYIHVHVYFGSMLLYNSMSVFSKCVYIYRCAEINVRVCILPTKYIIHVGIGTMHH